MEATLTFNRGGVIHSYAVEIVAPLGNDIFVPINAQAVEKELQDANNLKEPLRLTINVIKQVAP